MMKECSNGSVVSRTGNVIEGATVKSFSLAGEELSSTTTDASGDFTLAVSGDVTLTIEQDFTNNRTVSVRDALDALKLPIGMTKSDGTAGPLDFLAADMNQDGKVSVRDALDILKYSLKMDSSPAQWKFIPDDLDISGFSRKSASYDETMAISYLDLGSDQTFIGILVGDVNGTL